MISNLKKRILTSLGLILILIFVFFNIYFLGYILIVVGVLCLIEFFRMSKIIFKKDKIKQYFINIFFSIYIFCFCIMFLIFSENLYFKILIFLILFICVASDIGGFVFGKVFKGYKLTKISPNKTISGVLGSLMFSTSFIYLSILNLTNNHDIKILIIGLATSIGCQTGDLFFSFLKRKSFLKDTGNFLPGHGGILDRVDGILLGIPTGILLLLTIY